MSADPENVAETSPPRSTVLQGFLGTSSVVAYALIFELVRTLVVDSFDENVAVKVLDGVLQSLSVLVVSIAAGIVLFRFLRDRRAKRRAARELELVSELVAPGPALAERVPWTPPPPPRRVPDSNRDTVMAVLRELPVHDCETGALLAVLEAIREATGRLPVTQEEPPSSTAAGMLAGLRQRGVVAPYGAQRFCLRRVPIVPGRAAVIAGPKWGAAVTALLHYYADRAARWSIALESRRFAGGARRWFETEEPYLRRLIAACADPDTRFPVAAVAELARLGDALDVWYARLGWDENHSGVPADLCEVPGLDGLVLSRDLVLLRAGRLGQRPQRYVPRRLSTGLAARWEHAEALRRLATQPHELQAVAAQLETAWWLLPRVDVAAEVCALINLAVVHIRQGRLDAAQDRLELAESLTRSGRDPGGRAQCHETMGALWWARGESRRAVRCWQVALTCFRALDDDLGVGRCLQHLGSAVVVAPEQATLLLPADRPLTRVEVLRQATGWLAEARRRHPGARHADHYVERARVELRAARTFRDLLAPGRTVLTRIDQWPLPLDDRHAQDH